MERFTQNLLANRRMWLASLASVLAVCVYHIPSLRYEQSVGYLFRTDQQVEAVNADRTVMILLRLREPLSVASVQRFRGLEESIEALNTVDTVTSVFDARLPKRIGRLSFPVYPFAVDSEEEVVEANAIASGHPLVRRHLLTTDGQWMRMLVHLQGGTDSVEAIRQSLAPIRKLIETKLGSNANDVYVTGLPSLQQAIAESLQRDQQLFITCGAFVGWLMALAIFRNWRTVAVVVSGPVVGLVVTFGLMAAAGQAINPINIVVAPLAMAIALADAVHLQLEINRLRRTGFDTKRAIVTSMKRVGPACVMTAITTAIGFGALMSAEMLTVRELGVLGGVTVAIVLASVLVCVPLLAAGFLGDTPVAEPASSSGSTARRQRLGAFAINWPWSIVVSSILLMAFLGWKASRLQPDISIAEALPETSPASEALRLADQQFGGTSPIRIVISWNARSAGGWPALLSVIDQVDAAVEDEDRLAPPVSLSNLLLSLPEAGTPREKRVAELSYLPADYRSAFIDTRNHVAYVYTSMPDDGSQALIPVLNRLNAEIEVIDAANPPFHLEIEDGNVVHLHLADSLILSLLQGIAGSVLLCSLVITLGTRSIALGLISLLPNLMVLLVTAGVMALIDLPLQLTSMTVFTIAYGIGVDDTIHFLRQFQLSEAQSHRERVRETALHMTRPIVMTTLILTAGLSGVLFSEIPSLFHFGALFIGALFLALIGDLIVLPAALLCFMTPKFATPEPMTPKDGPVSETTLEA